MSKKSVVFFCLAIALLASSARAQVTGQTVNGININDLPDPNLNRAVVKVKVFALSADNFLQNLGHGSGIVISQSGIILTNYHVAIAERQYDSKPRKMGYELCFNTNVSEEPDCSYTASYIAGDKDLDLALLKIESLPGGKALPAFTVMPIAETDKTSPNDEVIAVGYPGIGGDTMTVTRGIISGKVEKYGKKWIKSDAMISFGNSGGAAINRQGELVGVTSAGHSDMLGSLGYIINSASIAPWVKANIAKTPAASVLTARVNKFSAKEKEADKQNVFMSEAMSFRITKPSDWQFDYYREDSLQIIKKEDEEAGDIDISAMTFPNPITEANFDKTLATFLASRDPFGQVLSNEPVSFKTGKGRRVTVSDSTGDTTTAIYAPSNNYLLEISYYYGNEDRDQELIEKIISGLELLAPTSPYKTANFFKSSNGVINYEIKSTADWPIFGEVGDEPAGFSAQSLAGNMLITANLSKEDAKSAKLTNRQMVDNEKKQIDSYKGFAKQMGIDMEYKVNADCQLTAKAKGYVSQIKMKKDGRTTLVISYTIRRDGKVMEISAGVFGVRADNSIKAKADFDKFLNGMTIESEKFKSGCILK